MNAWNAASQRRHLGAPSPQPHSLVLTSLEIGRALADRSGVTFRAQGTCMYPTLRPGDVLRIKPCPTAQVKVGDIAACRGRDQLFSHRVISKGEQEGRPYIVTRPDRSHHGSDGPTFDEDLLGVVEVIQRNGQDVPLTPQAYSWPQRAGLAVSCWWLEARPRFRAGLAHLLIRLQAATAYRWLVQHWFGLKDQAITFIVRVPTKVTDDIYEAIPADTFDLTHDKWRHRGVKRWILALHLDEDARPAVQATFQATPAGWVTQDLQVRLRYRGLGLEDRLLQRAQAIGVDTSESVTTSKDSRMRFEDQNR